MFNQPLIVAPVGSYQNKLATGYRLSTTPMAQGGWGEYFQEHPKLGIDLRMENAVDQSQVALLLENAKQQIASLIKPRRLADGRYGIDEATVSALLGGISDYLFPMIRAGTANSPIQDLFSMQVTDRKIATIIHWNVIVGRTKGQYVAGQRVFDGSTGRRDHTHNLTSELIERERQGLPAGNSQTFVGQLEYHTGRGIRPGTVQLSFTVATTGAVTISDDGNGGWTNSYTGSIDYRTGMYTFTTPANNVSSSASVYATYSYDSEGSPDVAEIDIQTTISTVETERRALKMLMSRDSIMDVQRELGENLEQNLVTYGTELIMNEICRQLIAIAWKAAGAAVATFPLQGPTEYSRTEHFRDIVYTLQVGSSAVHTATQKAYPNRIVCDTGAANLLRSLPNTMFKAAPKPANVEGVHFIGTLMDTYQVYLDILLVKLPGASSYGNMLLLYKGSRIDEAGLVYAPYQLIDLTEPLETADFIRQRGMMTRYATKLVNNKMFSRIALSAS